MLLNLKQTLKTSNRQ